MLEVWLDDCMMSIYPYNYDKDDKCSMANEYGLRTLHILVHCKLTNSFTFVVPKCFVLTVMLSQTTLMNSTMHKHKAGSLVQTCIINVI